MLFSSSSHRYWPYSYIATNVLQWSRKSADPDIAVDVVTLVARTGAPVEEDHTMFKNYKMETTLMDNDIFHSSRLNDMF